MDFFLNRSFGIHLDIVVCHINASGLIVVSYDNDFDKFSTLKAIAGEAGVPFFYRAGSEFEEM